MMEATDRAHHILSRYLGDSECPGPAIVRLSGLSQVTVPRSSLFVNQAKLLICILSDHSGGEEKSRKLAAGRSSDFLF